MKFKEIQIMPTWMLHPSLNAYKQRKFLLKINLKKSKVKL